MAADDSKTSKSNFMMSVFIDFMTYLRICAGAVPKMTVKTGPAKIGPAGPLAMAMSTVATVLAYLSYSFYVCWISARAAKVQCFLSVRVSINASSVCICC